MAISIGDAVLKLKADTTEITKGLKDTEAGLNKIGDAAKESQKKFEEAGKEMQKVLDKLTLTATALAGAMAAAIFKITSNYGKLGEELQNLSIKTGMGVEGLSELKYIAESAGGSLSGIESAVKAMNNALSEASSGTKTAGDALKSLGFNVETLMSMSPEDRFWALANSLAEIEDKGIRSALAIDVFGRSGTELLPILAQGTEALEAQRQKAHELGVTMTEENVESATAFDQSLDDLKAAGEGLQKSFAEVLAPELKTFLLNVTDIVVKVREWVDIHPELFDILKVLGSVLVGVAVFGSMIKFIGMLQKVIVTIRAFISALILAQSISGVGLAKVFVSLAAAGLAIWGVNKLLGETSSITDEAKEKYRKANEDYAAGRISFDEWSKAQEEYEPYKIAPEMQHGGIVPGPVGRPVPIIAHGGEQYLGMQNLGRGIGGNEIHIHIGQYLGDEASFRKFVADIKKILGQDGRRNAFGSVNQGYFFGRSSV